MVRKIHYAWNILALSFIGVLASQGLRYSFGAYMEPWQKDFSVSRGMVSAISFTSFIVFAISQPLIVQCIDRFGIKKMFVWSSLIAAAVLLGLASLLSALLPKGTETSFPFNVKEANSTT